jgi:hypothetical protein
MVCTWYNKVLSLPVLNKSAIGHSLGQDAGERQGEEPWGSYAVVF